MIDSGAFTVEQVARGLELSASDLTAYASGTQAMPLPEQLRFAAFVIEHAPALKRRGHTLRAQVLAAADFQAHKTSTHSGPPARWPRDR